MSRARDRMYDGTGSAAPAQFIPQHTPALVWVTTTSNAVVPVAQPQIDGDTLRGTWAGRDRPLAIPLQGSQSVQAKTPAHARTVIVLATAGLLTGVVIWGLRRSGTVYVGDACTNSAEPEDCT